MPKAQAAAKAAEPAPPADGPGETPKTAEGANEAPKSGKIDRPPAVDPTDLNALGSMEDGDEFLNVLWWGREGSWKTSEIATAANRGKLLVVNAEGGFKKKPLRELGIDLSNIVLWPDPKSGVELTVETMEDLFWRVRAALLADPGAFYAVAWDSVSMIYDRFVANERERQYKRNAALPAQKRKDFREDRYFTDRADYGVATEQLREALRRWRDLPCHFLITALERRDIDEETSKVAYGPAVGPAFQKDLLAYLDVIIATKVSTLQVGPDDEIDVVDAGRGLVRSNGKQRAKDRLRSLPRVMANPTFERVMDYVDDKIDEATDPVQAEWEENKRTDALYANGGPEAAAGGGEPGAVEGAPVDA